MWGYEGEELEDIAATVDHVKHSNPDVFFTTVSYPIKGTPYFDQVRDKVAAPFAWSESSDRDYVVAGRRNKGYYKLADRWLRSEVQAHRIEASDPTAAQSLYEEARQVRDEMLRWDVSRAQ
jgi:anaerobic magnesium-protoporphyrin IX monomethyl ester cyclase